MERNREIREGRELKRKEVCNKIGFFFSLSLSLSLSFTLTKKVPQLPYSHNGDEGQNKSHAGHYAQVTHFVSIYRHMVNYFTCCGLLSGTGRDGECLRKGRVKM